MIVSHHPRRTIFPWRLGKLIRYQLWPMHIGKVSKAEAVCSILRIHETAETGLIIACPAWIFDGYPTWDGFSDSGVRSLGNNNGWNPLTRVGRRVLGAALQPPLLDGVRSRELARPDKSCLIILP